MLQKQVSDTFAKAFKTVGRLAL